MKKTSSQRSKNWGVADDDVNKYEDLHAFLNTPAKLARELSDSGIKGMKIWPFDTAAEKSFGNAISQKEIDDGVKIIAAIRDEVGMDMDLMIELHGLWNRPSAKRIIDAITPYKPFWVEDPLRPDAVEALAQLRREISVPIAIGETAVGRRQVLPLLENGAVDYLTIDISWTGGLTEARKIASLADLFAVPVAPHDCTGPVALAISTPFLTFPTQRLPPRNCPRIYKYLVWGLHRWNAKDRKWQNFNFRCQRTRSHAATMGSLFR